MANIESGAVYRITSKASNRLRLELGDGDPGNGTQAQGWQEMTNESFYNQVWLLESDGRYWRFHNLRSGTYLDLSNGGSGNGAKVQGWQKVDNDNQKWSLNQIGSYWTITNKGTGTAIDLDNGGTSDGTRVQGWAYIRNDNQMWSFNRMSRKANEVQDLLRVNPATSQIQVPHYADQNYLVLPLPLVAKIYADSGIHQNFRWRSEIFDCDDFAFTFKAAVAKHGYDWVRADNIAIICGLMYGSKPAGKHAFNWVVTDNLGGISFIEPQNGQRDNGAFGYQAYFALF